MDTSPNPVPNRCPIAVANSTPLPPEQVPNPTQCHVDIVGDSDFGVAACSGDCHGSERGVGDRVEENGGRRGGAGPP